MAERYDCQYPNLTTKTIKRRKELLVKLNESDNLGLN